MDIVATLQTIMPGLVVQETMVDAASTLYASQGSLSSGDVTTILTNANTLNAAAAEPDYVPTTQEDYPTTLPDYPTGMPRFADSNPCPTDGWSIDDGGQVVNP